MPPNTIKVDRSKKWGNPFRVGIDSETAEDAKREYLCFLAGGSKFKHLRDKVGDVRVLKGHNLACWCGPSEPCHADVLLEIANQP